MKLLLTILFTLLTVSPKLISGEVEHKPITIVKKKADFRIAYQRLRRWEGNYVNDPDDYGLETYGGVTKRYNPDWYGWRYVEAKRDKRWNDSIPEAEFWVMDYYLNIWVKEGYYKLENQDVANYLFDLRVHLHTRQATKLINETYGLSINPRDEYIIPSLDTVSLYALKERRKAFYLNLIREKPHYKKFKRNWLKRAEYK